MSRTVAVVLNASSRSHQAAERCKQVERLLADAGVEADLHCARRGRDIPALARSVARRPYTTVIAAGGDGTVSAVAAALAGTDKTMAVLPLGTFNNFARHLGVPTDLDAAVRAIANGRRIQVDIGEVNGRVFVNNAVLGSYPPTVRLRDELQHRWGLKKWIAFAIAIAAALGRNRNLPVRLHTRDGEERRCVTPFLLIANHDYEHLGTDLGAPARLRSGNLSVSVAHTRRRLGIMWLLFRAWLGHVRSARSYEVLTTRELWVEPQRRRRVPVALDGEVVDMKTPLHFRARPGALTLIAPEGAPASVIAPDEIAPDEDAPPVSGDRALIDALGKEPRVAAGR